MHKQLQKKSETYRIDAHYTPCHGKVNGEDYSTSIHARVIDHVTEKNGVDYSTAPLVYHAMK